MVKAENRNCDYRKGVDDAEYVIKKLTTAYGYGGMHSDDIVSIFGTAVFPEIMNTYNLYQIIDMIGRYEEMWLEIGDVVASKYGISRFGTITKVYPVENGVRVLWEDGETGFYCSEKLRKIEGKRINVKSVFASLNEYRTGGEEKTE